MRWQIMILCLDVLICALAPILSPDDPMHTQPAIQLESPSFQHVLGTDMLGRDVLSRFLYGGQRTLFITTSATIIAVSLGTSIGILSAVSNRKVDYILSIGVNSVLAFPTMLIGLTIITLLGTGLVPLMIATGFTQIAPFARVIRSLVLQVRSTTYVEAGYAVGATRWHMVRFYILPNIWVGLLGYSAITLSYCLLNSAALSFLGLGGEPGVPDWGVMLAEGRAVFHDAPWLAFFPGLAITTTVWAINSWVDEQRARISTARFQ